MELAEPIEDINTRLERNYGKYDDKPNFRVVWSNDQLEKRIVTYTKDGFELINPMVAEVRKYSYIDSRFVLERLIPVDPKNTDLTEKISYEPAWTFNNANTGEYIPPRYDMCQVIIESILEKSGRQSGFAKYKDPNVNPEHRIAELDKMRMTLFGNETAAGDALAHGYGVVNPAVKSDFSTEEKSES